MNRKNSEVDGVIYDNKYTKGDTKQNNLEQMEINENKQKYIVTNKDK